MRNSRRMTLSRVDGVAVDVDPLDIDARRLIDLEADVHLPLLGIAVIGRGDVGEGIAEGAGDLVEAGDRVLDGLGVEPVALVRSLISCLDRRRGEVAQAAFGLDRAELVARPFLDDVGDDEIAAVGRQLGKRGNDAEIGIALGQVEGAQLLLVGGQPVGIVGVVRA